MEGCNMTFQLKDKVSIIPLEHWEGIIIGIWIANKGTQYQVRYFMDGKAEEVYFYEEELKVKDVKEIHEVDRIL